MSAVKNRKSPKFLNIIFINIFKFDNFFINALCVSGVKIMLFKKEIGEIKNGKETWKNRPFAPFYALL